MCVFCIGAVRCRERLGGLLKVLREGSGVKVDGTAGDGLTTYIEDTGNLDWQGLAGLISSTCVEQGSDQDEFFDHTRFLALQGEGITWTGQPSRQGIALFSVRIQFGALYEVGVKIDKVEKVMKLLEGKRSTVLGRCE